MIPSDVKLKTQSAELCLTYGTEQYALSAELLRVYSPSAEVRGHGNEQAILQTGKRHVTIKHIEAAGNYGLHINFSDGHNSGIFTWRYLHELSVEQDARWSSYLQQLREAGQSRDPDTQVVQIMPSR